MHGLWRPLILAPILMAIGACGDALDWRLMQPDGVRLRMAMPCRPAAHERSVPLAGAPVALRLFACQAQGMTFGLSSADMGDPARVGPALDELFEAARRNVRGQAMPASPVTVAGMTPHSAARGWRLDGQLPDGRAVQSQGVVFAYGTRVYQATVVGERLPQEAVRHFLESLAVQP